MSFSEHYLWCLREDPETGEQVKVFGVLRLPAGAEEAAFTHLTLPTVVLAHGIGSSHEGMHAYAEGLSARGVVTYCLDLSGSARGRSDGDPLRMTVETQALDVAAAVQLMSEEPFCDTDNLSLVGASQGGLACAAFAARNPARVKALALLYPAFCIHDDAIAAYPDPADVPDSYVTPAGVEVGRAYNLAARALDPFELMGEFGGDVLILHGDQDGLVDLSYSRRAARTFPRATLEVQEGAGHGFAGDILDAAVARVCEFIKGEILR
ncbi:alpha/beta fold hydrolase [Atopobiaceae bacterium HCP3S3_D6]